MINVKKVFDCLSGNTDLTEEFIYNNINKNQEQYLVLSSSTSDSTSLGMVPKCKNLKGDDINVFKDKMGILVARNGKAGKMTYLSKGNYTINDHAYILSLRDDFIRDYKLEDENEQTMFLKYFMCRYQFEVYQYSTKNDNATWNKTGFFKHCSIEIVNKDIMKKLVERYEKCEEYKLKIDSIDSKLKMLLNKTMTVEISNINERVTLNYILSYISRNDCLSEEGIYNFYPKGEKTIEVLSGSIQNIYYGKIDYDTPKIHKLENRQGLHIITRGKAGKLTYIKKGIYATNTNAFILYIDKEKLNELNITKDEEEEIYLKFLLIYLQPIFYEVSSNSDVSVFPLTNMMNTFIMPKFKYNERMKIYADIYDKSQKINAVLDENTSKIESLFDKQLALE